MTDSHPLDAAIADLEARRAALGDAVVDAAIAALRAQSAWVPTAGSSLAPSPAPPPVPTTTARLRQVSVLFADIAESTAMLGRVGAEDAMDLLGGALQSFADAVRQWDGEVLRFTGDGLKAAFGTQGLREDEAECAVRAGLQILDDAARHAERVAAEFGFGGFGARVGIHTGPVLLGGGVEAERSAMGHAVNLAARMEQSAPVGRLRISDSTWAQVRGLFDAEEQPPLIVKGHAEPLRTWLVRGVVTAAEPAVQRGLPGVATPLVGRDAEVAQLMAWHQHTVATGHAATALVLGDAGVGKTRLRREFLQHLGLAEGRPGLLQARAQPSTPLQPYGLLRQLLMRWFGIGDDQTAEAARQHLVAGLAPWLGEDGSEAAAWIGQLIGLDFNQHAAVQTLGPASLRRQAFAALRHALHASARSTPLLLVLDDLHWADEDSLAFVRTLLEPTPSPVPLALLLLARPTLAERGAAIEPTPPNGLTLCLAPLADAAGMQLVDALLQPLAEPDPALRRLLLDRAAGNPFFLEALVGMLIDDGVIDTRERPWQLHRERLQTLRVPSTLVAVLQARLDALPADELQALQQASIVGPVFWDAALQALDASAPAAVPALRARQLVAARSGSAFADTEEHAFVHQLLHDTTYDTVLKEQRRAGHARAAAWLAERVSQRADEFLAVTAQHFEHAGESERALHYWDLARSSASRRWANESALAFLDRALAQPALTDRRWRAHLLSTRYALLDRIGRGDEAREAVAAYAAYAEACDDDVMRADVTAHRMLEADHEGRPDEAHALALQTLALAERSGDPEASPWATLAHGELAWLAVQAGRHDDAARHIDDGLVSAVLAADVPARHGGYARYAQQLLAIRIDSLLAQHRHADALAALAQSEATLGPKPGPYDRFNLQQRRSQLLRALGRLDEAAACSEEMLALARLSGVARLQCPAWLARAEVHLLRGEHEAAADLLQRAEPMVLRVDAGFFMPLWRALQARLAQAQGDLEAAAAAWDDAIARELQQQRADLARLSLCERAWLDVQRGDLPGALAAVDDALAATDDGSSDAGPHWQPLTPPALLRCAQVLHAAHDPRATALHAELQRRLQAQLEQLPAAADRDALLQHVPHWRDIAVLLGVSEQEAPNRVDNAHLPA